MSRDASLTLDWADDSHVFRLPWKQLIQLQEECNAGPAFILKSFNDGTWKVQTISHILRLGLIGGGMDPNKARTMVRDYVEDRPPLENLLFAQAVLSAALMGAPDEDQKKRRPKAKGSMTSQTAKSATAKSSELAQ